GKMSAMGINVAIGTDNGAANIIENMRMALVSGRIYNHSITEPNPEKILEMVTINAAKALGMEKEIGSLEIGKKADIVIVNYNQFHLTPCTNVIGNLVHLALGNDVETVYIDGKRTVENGHVLGTG
ncbi:MAG: amidohydrolase family protein, partial [Lachnospiraceae bacterium]|nr:amidohydrolase family protein [Lachnospiraceae bacterium]